MQTANVISVQIVRFILNLLLSQLLNRNLFCTESPYPAIIEGSQPGRNPFPPRIDLRHAGFTPAARCAILPGMETPGFIILFDGDCALCNASVLYIIRRDPDGLFRFAAQQSEAGRRLIEQYRGADFDGGTLLLIKDGVCYERGDALLEICRALPRCRLLFLLLRYTPRPLRNLLYRAVARSRYRLFGRRRPGGTLRDTIAPRLLD